MRITTVIGARPQFIKAAPVSRALRRAHQERLLHTGQHYDPMMSAVFFDELGIPAPDVTLHVGSATHGAQTGRMLEAIEQDLLQQRPDAVMVYGDTNSTLAGALAAAKLNIPLIHVEAGLRSFVRDMPEEINRVLTDRLSALCCCPSETARLHLAAEGISKGVVVVGDVMLDALMETSARVDAAPRLAAWGVQSKAYTLATVHRAANTDTPRQLEAILAGFAASPRPILWPMHPRTRDVLAHSPFAVPPTVRVIEPLGYLDLVAALTHAHSVATDSGGLQKEAYWLGVPCLTLRAETEWVETVDSGWNQLVDADAARITAGLQALTVPTSARDAFGSVGASLRVVTAIEQMGQH
ncbi:MAG: UDP-N-acetylglucosamine 2-epimerase (non-hydrolyzing) [Gemmatimonadaceae bacterium]|nr:UDP-N-acetylglucosamine 2-epimerase (non-hydrolyzing) [Gemmatimonadaceae bacterium]